MLIPVPGFRRAPVLLLVVLAAGALVVGGCRGEGRDKGISDAELVKRGVPDPASEWTIDQCVKAAQVIATIGKANPAHLPRSRRTKASVYSRIATLCVHHVTQPTDVSTQMKNLTMVMEVGRLLLNAYGATLTTGPTYAQEFMDLSGGFLVVWAEGIPVSMAFLRRIPADDPTYQARMDGLGKMLSGVSMSVHAALAMVGNPTYPDFARARLARRIEETLPVLLTGVDKDRADILASLRDVARDSPNPNVRDPLERALKAAGAKTPTKP